MSARVVLIHDDQTFAEDLANLLRADGHEVEVFQDLERARAAPRPKGRLELQISEVEFLPCHGIRILATFVPKPRNHKGGWGTFVPEPATPFEVASAMRRLVSPSVATHAEAFLAYGPPGRRRF